jgi:hypothetical protein
VAVDATSQAEIAPPPAEVSAYAADADTETSAFLALGK